MDQGRQREFEAMVDQVEPRLRRALVATYGFQQGREATLDALGWAWEHWDRVKRLSTPVAYLYRVGQSSLRRRRVPAVFSRESTSEPWFEPSLAPALERLSDRQRTAVVLVCGFDWTMKEVAELMGVRVTTVQSHMERGLQSLRNAMEVPDHA
jgi:DNA-directed RNA polymerase specialized sigma24 family protein